MGLSIINWNADYSAVSRGTSDPLQLFYSTVGITDTNQQAVYSMLYNTLVSAGLVSALKRLQLFTENQLASQSNFLDANDTVAAIGNVQTGAFSKAGIVLNKDTIMNIPADIAIGATSVSVGVYNVTEELGGQPDGYNSFLTQAQSTNGEYALSRDINGVCSYFQAGVTGHQLAPRDTGVGLISVDRNGTTVNGYKNGVNVLSVTDSAYNAYDISAFNIGLETRSTQRAWYRGLSLTAAQHLSLWNALQTFNTSWNAL